MKNNNPHVVPYQDRWAVRKENSHRVSSTHQTQSEAIAAGRKTAQRERSELFIHRPNGEIRDRDSYGNDPNPPRDTKY